MAVGNNQVGRLRMAVKTVGVKSGRASSNSFKHFLIDSRKSPSLRVVFICAENSSKNRNGLGPLSSGAGLTKSGLSRSNNLTVEGAASGLVLVLARAK